MRRIYDSILTSNLTSIEEMLFLSGPRQVGKTTTSKNVAEHCGRLVYLNWDNEDNKKLILKGPSAIAEFSVLNSLAEQLPIIVFDEIHKYPDWKNFLKGFYDTYRDKARIMVTGSARLDMYKKGGDSLMGRYLHFRMHPFSVAEYIRTDAPKTDIQQPVKIKAADFDALFEFGGFPKPFLQRDKEFYRQWQRARHQLLTHEDIRDTNLIHDLNRLDTLIAFLKESAAHQITYQNLAKLIRASVDTITRWITLLEAFYFCFRVQPWSKNVTRSLIKEPKLFLWDWSQVADLGAKAENFIAMHLLKATQVWTDCGLGEYGLHYIRTLEKKEVDFVVSKNGRVWFLVEVKLSNHQKINPHLVYFQKQTNAQHAFQVVLNMPYVDQDCFSKMEPIIVPASTFLSQLV